MSQEPSTSPPIMSPQETNTSAPSMQETNTSAPSMSPQSYTLVPSVSSVPTSASKSKCPGGYELVNSTCIVSEIFEEITSSKKWRVWATKNHLDTENVWNVNDLAFYDNYNCTGSKLNDGEPIESGHYPTSYVSANAFDGNTSTLWGGQEDEDGLFWLGMEYNILSQVSCVSILDVGNRGVTELRVQAWQNSTSTWHNTMITKSLQSGQRKNITVNCPEGFELRHLSCTDITRDSDGMGAGVVVTVVVIAIIMTGIYYMWWRRTKANDEKIISPSEQSTRHLSLPVAVADQFIMPPSSPSSQSFKLPSDTYVMPPPGDDP